MADITLTAINQISHKKLLSTFDCGIQPLNEYLSHYALKNDMLGIGKTFIAQDEKKQIVGYVTLATAQIKFEELPDTCKTKLPRYPIPALRIARLAVHKDAQGKGIGKWLLAQTFRKILHVADITGVYAIIVDAKESSRTFYERYGFIKLHGADLTYVILVETVRRAIE